MFFVEIRPKKQNVILLSVETKSLAVAILFIWRAVVHICLFISWACMWCDVVKVLNHNYFKVGQNLLTSRQPSITASVQPVSNTATLHSHPANQQLQQRDDWQQTVSVLQAPSHAHVAHKPPLTHQPSSDLFPWLEEPGQSPSSQHVLPQISPKPAHVEVCVSCF